MKKMFFIIMLLAAAPGAWSQAAVWEYPAVWSDTTIVRHSAGGGYVVYARQGSMPATVAYHDNAGDTVYEASLPSGVTINDFRILDGIVYAGGSLRQSGYQVGLLGCFSIADLKAGNCNFSWMLFSHTPMNRPPCNNLDNHDLVTGVKRLEVFDAGGVPVVAYISDNVIMTNPSDYSSVNYHRTGCGDVACPSMAWSPNLYHYNKDGAEHYTDIAVTDNHVVVVSREEDSGYFSMEFYIRAAGMIPSYPPMINYPVYRFKDHKVYGRVMVAATMGDEFVAAYHYKDPTGNTGMALRRLSVSGGVPVLTGAVDIPLPYSGVPMEMRDVRYSGETNSVWLLTDDESPATGLWERYVRRIDMGNFGSGVYEERHYPGHKFQSLDRYSGGGYISSGAGGSSLAVGVEAVPGASPCRVVNEVRGAVVTPRMYEVRHPLCPMKTLTSSGLMPRTMSKDMVDRVCGE